MEVIVRNPWMKDAVVVVTTVAVFALATFVYLKLRPTVVLPPESVISKCPARWLYNTDTGECVPQYATQCMAFDPDKQSDAQKCDIARSCGTHWKGLCAFM